MTTKFFKIVLFFTYLFCTPLVFGGVSEQVCTNNVLTNTVTISPNFESNKTICSPLSSSNKNIKNELSESDNEEKEETHKVLVTSYPYKNESIRVVHNYIKHYTSFIPSVGKNNLYLLFRVFRI